MLKSFRDYLLLYRVGTTKINLAKEQGLNIAMHYIGKCIEENIRSV